MVGIDIVDLSSFSNKVSKKNFLDKIFTENEILYAKSKKNTLQTLGGIFAAKEAIVKAFGLNLSYILRRKIEIFYNEDGSPYYRVGNTFYEKGLSISHDGNYSISICFYNNIIKKAIDFESILPRRYKESNKGDYGRIAFLGGSKGMAGSIYMSSMASLRTGAGLSYIICPSSISNILQIKSVENIIKEIPCESFYYSKDILDEILKSLEKIDVLCIGPGMSNGSELDKLIREIIINFKNHILIDADGLNAISKNINILSEKQDMVLTPHLLEFSRITKLSIEEIKNNRKEIAINFAKKHKQILVLKGNKTIVTNGEDLYINNTGNPGMATAGSGDVLSGIISSLIYRIGPFEAAKLGVYIHGLAGDIGSLKLSEESLIATDIIDNIHEVFRIFRGNHA